jgi:hypothetical protein
VGGCTQDRVVVACGVVRARLVWTENETSARELRG